jgi:CelD/BcsL family acetyltransferase involved in cellulose biosynthesis
MNSAIDVVEHRIPALPEQLDLDLAAEIPATARLSLLTSLQGLLALEPQWRDLEKSTCAPITVFQSYDWVASWCQTFCVSGSGTGIHILAGFDQHRLVFVWPLAVASAKGVRVLSWLTEPFGQYGDVICASGACPRTWIAESFRFLSRLKGIDLLRLRHVRDDSTLATVAANHLTNAKLNEQAPFLDLTAFASDAEYENRYSGTQRKRRKKIKKHLEEFGPVSFNALPLGALSDRAIDSAISEKNDWLAARGRINQVMADARHAAFLKRLARARPQGMAMVVTELRAGDRPVSWEIAFRCGGTHFAYITSHANELTDLSPGRLHFDYSQRACLADGLSRYDLMVPNDAHKESWSSGLMPTQDYYRPLTLKGRIAGHLYLGIIRPVLRAAYYRMPQGLLRLINPGKANTSR